MTQEPFYLHKLVDGNFIPFKEDYSNFETIKLENEFVDLQLHPKYSQIALPKIINDLIDDFFSLYGNLELKNSLVNIIAGSQNLYRRLKDADTNVNLFSDFQHEKKDRRALLELLEKYHFEEKDFVKEVVFKNEKRLRIQNFFTIKDICDALIQHYELNIESREEFENRKNELLSETNQINYDKFTGFCRYLTCTALKNLFNSIAPTNNELFEIIAVFLNCAQIPRISNTDYTISPKFKENLSEIDGYQYIRNILNRKYSFTIK
ncbi:hypothetical protein [Gillisia sp. JM1]|uniref:hypothetical protein n=1 Tax=Gillisia sp. JM1 TaxID=1283286 RepID=UPI0003F7B488|nr:hypothetical protein [Gillisia sp. JM1]